MTFVPFGTPPSGDANHQATASRRARSTGMKGDDTAPGNLRMPDGLRRLVAGRHCCLDGSRKLRGRRHEIAAGRSGA